MNQLNYTITTTGGVDYLDDGRTVAWRRLNEDQLADMIAYTGQIGRYLASITKDTEFLAQLDQQDLVESLRLRIRKIEERLGVVYRDITKDRP